MPVKKVPRILPAIDPHQRWLTVAESARHIRRSQSFIRKLVHDGELKPSDVGGFLIDKADLDRYLIAHKRAIPPYRIGSRPWVAARHLNNRKKKEAA